MFLVGGGPDSEVRRFNAYGGLDRGFGNDGLQRDDRGGDDHLSAATVDENGRLLACGQRAAYGTVRAFAAAYRTSP